MLYYNNSVTLTILLLLCAMYMCYQEARVTGALIAYLLTFHKFS